MKVLFVLWWNGYCHQIEGSRPDEMKNLDLV
jgi:hypothetical protein